MTADLISRLNPTDGHTLAGVEIDANRFLARVKVPQLLQIAPDPRDTENRQKLASVKELQDIREIRDDVQRLFEGAKERNVEPYSEYIIDIHEGNDGITPPIILYSEHKLEHIIEDRGFGYLIIPWERKLVAIDGETQLAARYEAANRSPSSKDGYIAVYICHGYNKGWARQAFHDLNVLGVRPNAAVSIGMDARDPLTAIAREVERRVPFFAGRVNKTRRQLRGSDKDVVTISALRGACITIAEGIGGVRYGSRPVLMADDKRDRAQEVAVEWLQAATEAIGPAMEDRENKLASAPSVLAAIGAVGHGLVNIDDKKKRDAVAAALVEKLRSVDWGRGKHWEGIAGKFTPKGIFSIGGSKETAYAIFGAISDENSPAFKQIRPAVSIAA